MAQDEFPAGWERLADQDSVRIYRLRVLGGWLVMFRIADSVHTDFVEDSTHLWVIES